MGQANSKGLLTLSAILTLVCAPGWMRLALPDRPHPHGDHGRVSGKSGQAAVESRAREEKSDCEDCVIVLREDSGHPSGREAGTAGREGMSGSGVLAGTLWGLFLVARPKRKPRTIIRGVTLP